MPKKPDYKNLFKTKGGIRLDIGCGADKQEGFVGMDRQPLPGVDIVHDLEVFPYPLPDECCLTIIGTQIVEHIKPWVMIDFMNELWRIMRFGGKMALVHPYGVNNLYVQDPTHCNPCNEVTWEYFDSRNPYYAFYRPKPWHIEPGFPTWQTTGHMEVILKKVKE